MRWKELSLLWLAAALILPACRSTARGSAVIRGTQPGSALSGTAIFTPADDGLQATMHITHAPPGLHGLHLHEQGACGDEGRAAGGHYNPDRSQHGFLPTDGFQRAHTGDFGNLTVGADGSGSLTLILPGLRLRGGPHSVAGRAVILHAEPDDFTQPTGNAGGRIGCGVVTLAQ